MDNKSFNKHIRKINTSEKSLNLLYDYYYGRIVLYIQNKYRNNHYIAKDVAQEFFLYLVHLKEKPYVKFPTAWVYTFCDHTALRMLKKDQKFVELNNNMIETIDELDFDLYGEFEDIIKTLDDTMQKIIKMMYIEGYNMKEVAKILNIEYGTIRQKHSRCMKKIKKNYKSVTN